VKALWRLLAANRDYRLLVSAGLVSLVGDYVLGIGLTFLVYQITGSTLASGAMMLASYLPSIVLGSLAGVMVDRWNRRTTMIVANVLQVAGLVPLLTVHDSSTIWVVYVVAAYQGCIEQFFMPAEQALIPHLVPKDDLVGANGVNAQMRNLARLVGSAVGGILATVAGISGLAIFDAVSFVLAAALLSRIRFRPAAVEPAPEDHAPVGSLSRLLTEWRAGLRTCLASRHLLVILVFMSITQMGEGIMGTLFAPFVKDVLHGNGSQYGLIVGIQGVGGIIGGLAVTAAGHRWSAYTLFGWGAVTFGIVDLVLFLYPVVLSGVVPALVCMLVVGIPGACTIAGMMTTFQTMTSDEFRGRVFGAMMAVGGLAILAGIGIASWLGGTVGIVPIIAIQGAGYVAGGFMVILALRGSAAADVHVADGEAAPGPVESPGDLPAGAVALD
jgi:Na+/melibiose symporter-like transporter